MLCYVLLVHALTPLDCVVSVFLFSIRIHAYFHAIPTSLLLPGVFFSYVALTVFRFICVASVMDSTSPEMHRLDLQSLATEQ